MFSSWQNKANFSSSFLFPIVRFPFFVCTFPLPPRSTINACIDGLAHQWKCMDDCPLIDFCHTASQHWEAVHQR